MANDEIHPVSIYGSARSVAAMRTPDHMLTKVESNRIVATDCSSGPVLVVDDDPAVRHLISDYFGQQGIQTVSATGRSAVARQLAGGDTSAIILDLHLGQDDGFDLLREIRSSSDVPVIILTGRARDEGDCVVGLELGADRLPQQAVRYSRIVCPVPRRAEAPCERIVLAHPRRRAGRIQVRRMAACSSGRAPHRSAG